MYEVVPTREKEYKTLIVDLKVLALLIEKYYIEG